MSVHSLTATELEHEAQHPPASGRRLALLTLTALGVVYGDIGTSPLYALRECFKAEYGIAPTHDNVTGVLSLIALYPITSSMLGMGTTFTARGVTFTGMDLFWCGAIWLIVTAGIIVLTE